MKILMICLGNICRSPLAHGVLAHLVEEAGLDWQIDSAGTGNWHVGSPPDKRSIAVAKKYGIDISQQRCRQFQVSDFDAFDRIIVMDTQNLEDILSLARDKADRSKVSLLLSENSVPDPYWDDTQFDSVFHMIDKACRKMIQQR